MLMWQSGRILRLQFLLLSPIKQLTGPFITHLSDKERNPGRQISAPLGVLGLDGWGTSMINRKHNQDINKIGQPRAWVLTNAILGAFLWKVSFHFHFSTSESGVRVGVMLWKQQACLQAPRVVTPPFLEGDNGNKQQTQGCWWLALSHPRGGGCTSCVGWHADIPALWRVRPDSEECHRICLPLKLLDKPHMDIWGWPNKWKHSACLLSAYVSLIRWMAIFTFPSVCKEHLRVVEWLTQSTLHHYHYVCCLSWGLSSKWALPSYIYHFTQRQLSSAAGSCGITCSFKGETLFNTSWEFLSLMLKQ